MKVVKKSNLINGRQDFNKYKTDLDSDIKNLVLLTQGRIRFGDGTDGYSGENIAGQFQQFTSHASADTEFAVAHTLGAVPVGFIMLWQDKAGSLYQGPATGTAWTTSNVYLKCNVTSLTAKIFLIK